MKKVYKKLSEFKVEENGFIGEKDIFLFRSADPTTTAIYCTNVDSEEIKKAYFEVLMFGKMLSLSPIFIKAPWNDYFYRVTSGGGSQCGIKTKIRGTSPWEDYVKEYSLFIQDNSALIEYTTKFDFLNLVAEKSENNKSNLSLIDEILNLNYLDFPNYMQINYACKDESGKIFIAYVPKYNYEYNNYKFFCITDNKPQEYKITQFIRYRDGGTTIITVEDNKGEKHEFFSPSRLAVKYNGTKDICIWDKNSLIYLSVEEKDVVAKLLEIEEEKEE